MSIPLVQNNEKDSINTSIIAIKRNIERINMLLGLVDSGSPDLSGLATKQELEDAITQVETDLAPVDEVTSGNMHSVTSNAVAEALETVDSWSSSGVSVYRIGKIVSLHFYAQISSSTRYTLVTIPERFRPSFNVRFLFLKNSTDDPFGQAVLETDGKLTLWAKNGSGFNDSYGGTVSYIL